MGFMDDLSNVLGRLNEAANAPLRSQYDPSPSLETDGIVTEPGIPADERGFKTPREQGYAHYDQPRDPGIEDHILTENAIEPLGEFPNEDEDWRNPPANSRDNPSWGLSAPADLLSVGQYSIGKQSIKVREENRFRISMTIQNLATSGNVYFGPNAGSAQSANGAVIPAGQSAVIPYLGELWLSADNANTIISVIETARKL